MSGMSGPEKLIVAAVVFLPTAAGLGLSLLFHFAWWKGIVGGIAFSVIVIAGFCVGVWKVIMSEQDMSEEDWEVGR